MIRKRKPFDIAERSDDLGRAASCGELKKIEEFLEAQRFSQEQYGTALRKAAFGGFLDCVAALLPFADPKNRGSEALRNAAMEGHVECVRMLIPVSDPKVGDSAALVDAAIWGHKDCMDLLWDVSEPSKALLQLQKFGYDDAVSLMEKMVQEKTLREKYEEHPGKGDVTGI